MKTMMMITMAFGVLAGKAPIEEVPAALAADEPLEIREDWDPACLIAISALRGLTDPDEFEEAAFRWLESHEAEIAAEMAASRGRLRIGWRHEEADNTPFGTTVVVLGSEIGEQPTEAASAGSGE